MSSTATGQIMARIPLVDRAEYEALAALNGVTLSELLRQSMEHARDHFRKTGEEASRRRNNLPHGVTPTMEEQAMGELILELNSGSPITLKLRDILTPRSKALYRLLQIVWAEDPSDVTRKALDKVAARVTEFMASDPPQRPERPPRREVKAQARRD